MANLPYMTGYITPLRPIWTRSAPRSAARPMNTPFSIWLFPEAAAFTNDEALATLVIALCTLPGTMPKWPVAEHVLPLFRQRPGAEILADRIEAYLDTAKPRHFSLREIVFSVLCDTPDGDASLRPPGSTRARRLFVVCQSVRFYSHVICPVRLFGSQTLFGLPKGVCGF